MPEATERDKWGQFFRDNFDKILLVGIFVYCSLLVLHLTHDSRDSDLILWGREISGTVLGALLGLITGHALAQRSTTTTATANPPKVVAETTTT